MNNVFKVILGAVFVATGATAVADGHGPVTGIEDSANKATARAWLEAGYKGRDEFIAVVKETRSDDGVFVAQRYVGLGFMMDPDNDDAMTVLRVTPDTPAAEVLKAGDVFVSVNGIAATKENEDKVSFRGKPGEPVKAMIKRDGKQMEVEVKRGVINARTSKAKMLENMADANADDWPVDSYEIGGLVEEGSVIFAVSTYKDTEEDTGIEWTERIINRFVFDENGKVAWVVRRGESRFVLEQLGYTITR